MPKSVVTILSHLISSTLIRVKAMCLSLGSTCLSTDGWMGGFYQTDTGALQDDSQAYHYSTTSDISAGAGYPGMYPPDIGMVNGNRYEPDAAETGPSCLYEIGKQKQFA